MAAIRSLGTHTPTALPYLIAEGILPEEPSEKEYFWETYDDEGSDGLNQEEVVSTSSCVVYSTGEVVRKVFRFEVEEQKVQQAVLTWFPLEDDSLVESKKRKRTSLDSDQTVATIETLPDGRATLTASLSVRQKPGYGVQLLDSTAALKKKLRSKQDRPKRARALVVFLKFQAHIYFLQGSSHVVNLPFEVERAFPAPRGLIIQRRLPAPNAISSTPLIPSVPQNSFLSPEALHRKRQQVNSYSQSKRPKERSSAASRSSFALDDILKSVRPSATEQLPRHFSFTDPLSEMGLVVTASSSATTSTQTFQNSALQNAEALSIDEEILFVSPSNELPEQASSKLILLVTANHARKAYHVYSGAYIESKPLSAAMRRKSASTSGAKARRRSSFVPGTGATTPAVRSRDQTRESLGVNSKVTQSQESSAYQTAEETFASQLDPDFDRARQPGKESRRVSSLLSRADLSTNHDRSTFQDMASGHGASTSTYGRRPPSLGAAASRASLGGRKSYARASTPGSVLSRASLGYSSDEETVEDTQLSRLSMAADEDMIPSGQSGYSMAPFQEPFDSLHKEFVIQKVAEIPMDRPGSFSSWTKAEHLHKPRIFAICEPRSVKSAIHEIRRLCLHIVQRHTHDHIEIVFNIHKLPIAPTSKLGTESSFVPVFESYCRYDNQLDAIKIADGDISRVLSLQKDASSSPILCIRTCWASNMSPLQLPVPNLNVFNPFAMWDSPTSGHRPTTGRRRTLDIPQSLSSLAHTGSASSFDVVESDGRNHRLQIQLSPRNDYIRTVLDVCRFVLPDSISSIVMACWWKIMSQLPESQQNREWVALVTVLLSLAAGHVAPSTAHRHSKSKSGPRSHRRDRSLLPLSSDAEGDPMERMWGNFHAQPGPKLWDSPAWNWCFKSSDGSAQSWAPLSRRSDLVVSNIQRARAFIASEVGSALLSPLYDRGEAGRHDVPRVLVALHLLREEQKLDITGKDRVDGGVWDLAPILAQLGQWVGWKGWGFTQGGYFDLELAGAGSFEYEEGSHVLPTLRKGPFANLSSYY